MAEIPSVPQLYSDIHYARMFLNAASREDDPERQRSLAAIGRGFAELAHVEATWLSSPAAQDAQEPPELPDAAPARQLDLRAESEHEQPR